MGLDDMETAKVYFETSSIENGVEMRKTPQLGCTDADDYEMRILGRTQQLNVRILLMAD